MTAQEKLTAEAGSILANKQCARGGVVRCGGCELEPKKPARYCECCGKEISQHQPAKASETIDTDWAPKRSAWDLRCPKCGGPSLDGGICQVCQKPAPPVDRTEPAPRVNHAESASPKPQAPVTPSPSAVSSAAPAPIAPSHGASHSAPTPTPVSAFEPRAVPQPPVSMRERTPVPQPRQVPADAAGERPRRAVGPAVRPKAPAKTANRAYSFALIAASVVLVAVIGAAADYFFVQQEPAAARVEPPAAAP